MSQQTTNLFFDDKEWSGRFFKSGNAGWFQLYHTCQRELKNSTSWGFLYYNHNLHKKCPWCKKEIPDELKFSLDILCST